MSLLIEALKRAEDDSRKRKLAAAAMALPVESALPPPASPVPAEPLPIELALETPGAFGIKSTPDPSNAAAALPPAPLPAKDAAFPELSLELEPGPAAAVPVAVVQTSGLKLQPDATRPAATKLATSAGGVSSARVEPVMAMEASTNRYTGNASDASAPTDMQAAEQRTVGSPVSPRQAQSAARVMAGTQPKKNSPTKQRQTLLAAAVVLGALPVAAFFLFGDSFFNSSSLVVATGSSLKGQAPPTPVTSQPAATASPAAAQTASVPASVKASPVAAAATPQALRQPEARTATRARPTDGAAAPLPKAASAGAAASSKSIPLKSTDMSSPASVAKPASSMELAYAAYQAGNSTEAARLYREVLKADPAQRDAWLGLAVIAHTANQREPAMDAYKRVLRLEPQNATALAGISSLSSNADEPRQESSLRELLARSPQEADLNHALGLVLSGQKRWSEAQPLFFKAHTLAPQEPQFAYNLAITLDHLRKPGLAIQYYEAALTLAQGKAAAFDEASARARLAALRAGASGSKVP